MSRPGREGGAVDVDAAILPDILNARHPDGTPITLESCLLWSAHLEAEAKHSRQEWEGVMCNFDGDPREAALLEELAREIKVSFAVAALWMARAEVFRAVAE